MAMIARRLATSQARRTLVLGGSDSVRGAPSSRVSRVKIANIDLSRGSPPSRALSIAAGITGGRRPIMGSSRDQSRGGVMATDKQKEAARRNIGKARQAQSARAHGEDVPRQDEGPRPAERETQG